MILYDDPPIMHFPVPNFGDDKWVHLQSISIFLYLSKIGGKFQTNLSSFFWKNMCVPGGNLIEKFGIFVFFLKKRK